MLYDEPDVPEDELEEGDLAGLDHAIHIENLKEQAERIAGGEMSHYVSKELPPEVEEQFWENVVDYESAAYTSLLSRLAQEGIETPTAEDLDDGALHEKLWEIIHALARRRIYLYSTNHLSDRELYEKLISDLLPEEYAELGGEWNMHLDILGAASEEDIFLYHKFYADEESRQRWKEEWPDDEMPDRIDPPFDRDRLLPKSDVQ